MGIQLYVTGLPFRCCESHRGTSRRDPRRLFALVVGTKPRRWRPDVPQQSWRLVAHSLVTCVDISSQLLKVMSASAGFFSPDCRHLYLA